MSSALFMEQGTGKTLVTIAFFQYLLETYGLDRYIIVCPLSVIDVWETQLKKHWEDPPPTYIITGKSIHIQTGPGVFLINYEKALKAKPWLPLRKFDVAVVDESHRIKNSNSKQSKVVAKLTAPIRMILTGTPIGNNPIDLFAQFRFLDPTAFGTAVKPFRNKFCRTAGFMGFKWKIRPQELGSFMRIVNRYAFRVSNKVLGLPPEIPMTRYFTFYRQEENAYTEIVNEMILSSQNFTVTTPLVVTQLMKLRQITGGFVKDDEGANQRLGDSKLRVLEDYLKNDLPEPDEPFVVFCVFRQEVEDICAVLKRLKIKHGVIQGGVEPSERARLTRELGKSVQAAVCQISSGGVGIDLTGAAISIFYSTDFSFINYYQARARVYRHGQMKKVINLHLIAKKTIDEDCHEALLDKADVARRALSYLRKEIKRYG